MNKKSSTVYAKSLNVERFSFFSTLRTVLHLVGTAQFCYAIYYDYTYVHFPASESKPHNHFGGKFKYLTFLDAIIQATYFIIAVFNDFFGTNEVVPKEHSAIRKCKDYVFATLAFPLAWNVGISFWFLYAIDRELVFPKILDTVFPSWLNHAMHTNIVVFIVLEMLVSFREYPTRRLGVTTLASFMISYLAWIHVVKHYSGVWVYPVLEVLQLPQRIAFFLVVLIFTICLYIFGEFMNNAVWAKEIKKSARKIN